MDPLQAARDLWSERELYLVYWFERIVPMEYLQRGIQQASNLGRELVEATSATVAGAVHEVRDQVVDPLVHAVEQPVAGLAHSLGATSSVLRLGTYVAGGWLLWNMYQDYYVAPQKKRQLMDTIDQSVQRQIRRQRRF